MRIARLLIYEGTEEALEKHFSRPGLYVRPGERRVGDYALEDGAPLQNVVSISEPWRHEPGGRTTFEDGEIPAIKVVK